MIELLSDETINQIAAGEVVESPSSVVKELVENSLDAQAKKVKVQIVGGGLQQIDVIDDGMGMTPQDAALSVVRHATSKIRKAQDLFHLSSMGFRGEALASTSAISNMTIHSSREGVGTVIEMERGQIIKTYKRARSQGTTVTVRQLFHNVPARKKFQKGPPALAAEIFKLMTSLCLSHPDVQFELVTNGRKAIQTQKGENLEKRALSLLGKNFFDAALPLEFKKESLDFQGWIGSPTMSRPNRMAQYLFINQRTVACSAIADAVRKGYGTRLEERRHPLFLLHLHVPSDLVDVNMHPQKLHVRLRKEELFRNAIYEAIQEALGQKNSFVPTNAFTPNEVSLEKTSITFREEPTDDEIFLPLEKPSAEILGIFNHFIICRQEQTLSMIDAEAASFCILFEELCNKSDRATLKQGLLVPITVHLTPIELAMILTHQSAIEQMGFTVKVIGKDTVMVEALPPFLNESQVGNTLCEMAQALQEFIGKASYHQKRNQAIALIIAKKGKSKQIGSMQEAQALLQRLEACQNQTHCPEGQNVRIQLDVETIERLFKAHQPSSGIT